MRATVLTLFLEADTVGNRFETTTEKERNYASTLREIVARNH